MQMLKTNLIKIRKDVRLPVSLQRAMATEAEASREARAKVVKIKSTKILLRNYYD